MRPEAQREVLAHAARVIAARTPADARLAISALDSAVAAMCDAAITLLAARIASSPRPAPAECVAMSAAADVFTARHGVTREEFHARLAAGPGGGR
ncbi:hypothetical protein SAMN05216200_11412 [Oceanicella actignis]|uniref:Uncharacterized protein n=2 Tax=Oceanicella actignis TaxID=1189325 RepID=A0A1M7U1I6_9RHOB|nr:hypothetical protein SAMN04488119_101410 [Oceanicella actignis]SHN76859.1 hypothetical protein SAMN05216200_11412 [Oceanicella actignis]